MEESPFLGAGAGLFPFAWPEFRPPTAALFPVLHAFVNYAHNDYLQVASQTGLLGLAAFVFFWLLMLTSLSGSGTPLSLGVFAAAVAMLLHGLTDANLTAVP